MVTATVTVTAPKTTTESFVRKGRSEIKAERRYPRCRGLTTAVSVPRGGADIYVEPRIAQSAASVLATDHLGAVKKSFTDPDAVTFGNAALRSAAVTQASRPALRPFADAIVLDVTRPAASYRSV
jgi:hypothetical protein